MGLQNRSMVDWLFSRIRFLRSILMDFVWLFLNNNCLFHYSNVFYSTTPVGVVTSGTLTEYSGSGFNFLGIVNDAGLLRKWKWLFPLLSLLSELVRLDSSSTYLHIFASNVVKVFFIWIFRLLMSELLDLLDRLALELLLIFLLCCFLAVFIIAFWKMRR